MNWLLWPETGATNQERRTTEDDYARTKTNQLQTLFGGSHHSRVGAVRRFSLRTGQRSAGFHRAACHGFTGAAPHQLQRDDQSTDYTGYAESNPSFHAVTSHRCHLLPLRVAGRRDSTLVGIAKGATGRPRSLHRAARVDPARGLAFGSVYQRQG